MLCRQPSLRARPGFYNHLVQPASPCDGIDVILVSPRNPLNIGAVARAMANFGLSRLTVITPYDPSWRQARSAIDAEHLLLNAHESPSLAAAVAHCTLVAGTATSRYRHPEQPHFFLPAFIAHAHQELAAHGHIAIVFGSEKFGLSREDLSLCNVIVEIPTHPRQPSMNLGQAVAVCLYALTQQPSAIGPISPASPSNQNPAPEPSQPDEPEELIPAITPSENDKTLTIPFPSTGLAAGDLNRVAELILETMQAARYSPASMRLANQQDLRLMLRRWSLSNHDLRRALGLFRRILWKLHH